MGQECPSWGETFETAAALLAHGCVQEARAVETPELDASVEATTGGDVAALHAAIAAYAATMVATDDVGVRGALHDASHAELADGLDAAARAGGWTDLASFADDTGPGDDGAGIVQNAVARFVVRTPTGWEHPVTAG